MTWEQGRPAEDAATRAPSDDGLHADARVVRTRSPDVEYVEVGTEVVAWHRPSQQLHLLDETTTLVFLLADGAATLAETVDELCAVHRDRRGTIEEGVQLAAGELVRLGLAEVVAPDAPRPRNPGSARQEPSRSSHT